MGQLHVGLARRLEPIRIGEDNQLGARFGQPQGVASTSKSIVGATLVVALFGWALSNNDPVGTITQSLTFVVPDGIQVSNLTGAVAVDDQVTSISVNGQSIGFSTPPYNTAGYTTRFVIPQTLNPGPTTITFSIYNKPNYASYNPEGLNVQWLSATINAPTPTPTPLLV